MIIDFFGTMHYTIYISFSMSGDDTLLFVIFMKHTVLIDKRVYILT
jgi:hypothetical protein